MTDRTGQLFGNYRLIHLLGQGGFADVYLAEHVHLNTHAAIKVLRTQLTNEDVVHFRNEARIIAHLEHPHIVQVLDFEVEGDTPFLVMMYAPNGTLRQRHSRGVSLPAELIVEYVKQVASALQFAHQQRLIHRDIKPENMLLGRDNEVLLSDFGIALVTPSTRAQSLFDQSRTSSLVGTVPYMAPEQIQGRPSLASDQYALGVVVYEWLCGQPPFLGMPMEVAVKHITMLPPLLREKDPTIPADVEKVVLTALTKDPRQRFATVQAFATALEQACQKEPAPRSMSSSTALRRASADLPGQLLHVGGANPDYVRADTTQSDAGIELGEAPQQVASGWMGSVTPVLTPPLPPTHTGYGGGEGQSGGVPPIVLPSQPPSSTPIQMVSPSSAPGNVLAPSHHSPRTSHPALHIGLCITAVLLLLSGSVLGILAYRNSLPTPAKALDAFCTALQSKDDQTAYHQLSSAFQSRTSEAAFAGYFANVATCTHGAATQTGNIATANLTTTASGQTTADHVTLMQDSTGAWKIDDDTNLSGLTKTLNTYCTALQSGDYATAYGQFSSRLQGNLSEAQFNSFFPQPSSCSYAALAQTTGGATTNIITTSSSGQSETDLVSLVLDSTNTWKIDDVTNLPAKTLDAFCSALEQRNYQMAYMLTSNAFQGGYPESKFASDFSAVTSCTYDTASVSGGNVTANMTLGVGSGQTLPVTAFLIKDSTGAWKIDNLVNLPDQTLTTFCNAVQQGDYQTAYNQLSTGFQQQVSEPQFASAFSGVNTCTHDFPIQTGDHATAHMQLASSSGQTVNVQVILIQDSTGNWKIDSLQKV
jgi:serine/threonine protein kinase/limonene-1,2-epoxide hydrolase